jgi:hypothetical protein
VLRIRDVYPGSEFFHSGSRVIKIPEPGSGYASKNIPISIYNPEKLFRSSRKYDPGCSSRIRIPNPDLDFLPIPVTGVKKAPDPDPGPGSATLLESLCRKEKDPGP